MMSQLETKSTEWMKKLGDWFYNESYPQCDAVSAFLKVRNAYLKEKGFEKKEGELFYDFIARVSPDYDVILRRAFETIEKEEIPAYKKRIELEAEKCKFN